MPKVTGLYVHVPFCVAKCRYCDFFSVKNDPKSTKNYLLTLEKEISALPDDFEPQTLYIGGGTPTSLQNDDFERFFAILKPLLSKNVLVEATCEVNPGTFSQKKAKILEKNGINRVSLGVQSMNDHVLRFLGRIHDKNDVFEAVSALKSVKIDNFSLDLMYGLPKEAGQVLEEDLEGILALNPSHISCYCLTYEPGTPLTRQLDAGEITACDDETCLQHYTLIREKLQKNGFEHYEISNFAKFGRQSRHNQLYWTGKDYIGIGPAAHSYWKGIRYSNPENLTEWQRLVEQHGALKRAEKPLSAEKKARERLVMGLRMLQGVDLEELRQELGFDIAGACEDQLDELGSHGMICRSGTRIWLSDEALFVSNSVFSELI
jgi:oxygen-independent coproporphyrinogen-3 oxidase